MYTSYSLCFIPLNTRSILTFFFVPIAPSTFTWEQAIYGILFLTIGGIELFHGYKYIRLTMLVAGFLVWGTSNTRGGDQMKHHSYSIPFDGPFVSPHSQLFFFFFLASTAVMIMITLNSVDGVYESAGVYFAVWLSVGILGAIVSFFLWHVGIVLTGTYGM